MGLSGVAKTWRRGGEGMRRELHLCAQMLLYVGV
jgi:hypothetical protein